jgi:uncharacterized repeat protein (TIGR01451 family)
LAGCAGTVTVVKQIVPVDNAPGDVSGALPGDGWFFQVSGRSNVTFSPSFLVTEFGSGADSFTVQGDFGESAGVTIAESVPPPPVWDYHHFPVGGENAVCTRLIGDDPEVLVFSDQGSVNGEFSFSVAPDDVVNCTVYNQPNPGGPPDPASVIVDKVWQIVQVDGQGEEIPGTLREFANGTQPPEFSASLTLAEDIEEPYSDLAWGHEYAGLAEGRSAEISEEVRFPSGCTWDQGRVTAQTVDADGAGGSDPVDVPIANPALPFNASFQAGANRYVVTNRFECRTQLALHKTVGNGNPRAGGELWTLRATGPNDALPGPEGTDAPSGDTGVIADVTPGARYVLSESGGDPNYVQFRLPEDELQPFAEGSTGSWLCAQEDVATGQLSWLTDGLRGSIAAPYGATLHCFTLNFTAELTLVKAVEAGGTAAADEWTFALAPDAPAAAGVTGYQGLTNSSTVNLRPGQAYELTEEPGGPANYALTGLSCAWEDREGNVFDGELLSKPRVTLGVGATGRCVFTNTPTTDVSITKTHSEIPGGTLSVGDQFDYVLTVTNSGAVPAQNTVVTDVVPASLRVVGVAVPADPAAPWVDESNGNSVRVSKSSFSAGTAEILVTVSVTAGVSETLVNEACVAADNNPETANNCATDEIAPPSSPAPAPGQTPPPTSGPAPTPPAAADPTPSPATHVASGAGGLAKTGAAMAGILAPIGVVAVAAGLLLLATSRTRRPRRSSASTSASRDNASDAGGQ